MKGGTYQVITEADGTKRFSDGTDRGHNENGESDVGLIRSLFPDQDDNDIIQNSIGDDNTYGWLRNLSDKSKLSSEETPVEKQFRSLNTEQQNRAIAATKDAINTRLNDSNFPFKWMSSDSVEYRKKIESGIKPHDIQRWKLKDDYSGSGDMEPASGHKLAIEQLRKTLGNFKSIQSDITAEQEKQEEERRRQKKEKMLQASQATAKEAEKHRQGIQDFGREIKGDFVNPLSNILDDQKALAKLTKKQKFPRAQVKLQIHAKKMEVKRYHDGLQSDRVRHNLTLMERNKVFQENIKHLSSEHKKLHNEIIDTTTKQFEDRQKELEGNLAELAESKAEKAKKAKKVVEEGAVMNKAAAAAASTSATSAPADPKKKKITMKEMQAQRAAEVEVEEEANRVQVEKILKTMPHSQEFMAAVEVLGKEREARKLIETAQGIFTKATDGQGISDEDLVKIQTIHRKTLQYMNKAAIVTAREQGGPADPDPKSKGGKTRRKKRYKTKTRKHKKKSKTKRARKYQKKRKTKRRS